jgi:uncharacterized protein (UPF0303 family)
MTDADLPVYTVASLEAEPVFDVPSFTTDDAVDLGLLAVDVIRTRGLSLAVRIVLHDDEVFLAKLGATGPVNNPWLAGKALVAEQFREPSMLVRQRHLEAGTAFADRTDVDHAVAKGYGGAIPLFVAGELVGSLTTSGQADVVDHAAAAETVQRYLSRSRG